jgi:hypothetical protein
MAAAIAAALAAGPAWAQAQTPAAAAPATEVNTSDPMAGAPVLLPAGTQDRTLGGHVFIPEVLVRTPFAATQVQANLLYGSGTAKGPALTVRLQPIADGTYEFASMSQIVGFEKKIAEGISAGGGITAQLISGIDGKSVVVVGTQIGYGLFGRFTAGQRVGPVQAAFTFDVQYGPRYGIFILNALDRALSPPPLDTINQAGTYAFTSDNAWTLQPGFSTAWAPLKQLGFTASADYQWISQKSDAGTTTGRAIDLGAAADWDFGAYTSAPVGLLAAWHWTAPLGTESSIGHVIDYSLGVFYTGRPALVMGLEVGRRSFPYRSLDTDETVVQLRVQYFW